MRPTESTPLILDDDLDHAEKGTYTSLPLFEQMDGQPFETDSKDNDYDQPIITLIRDPQYSVPDDIGDKVFDSENQPLGAGLDYPTLYEHLTAPPVWHRYMKNADNAENLRTLRKTGLVFLDLNFEYYSYALPVAVPLFFLSVRFLQKMMDLMMSSLGIAGGDSEINWNSFIYLLIPILFVAVLIQKIAKESYLLKRGDREAEFPHDYLAWLEAHPQTKNPRALFHPRTEKDYRHFYAYHTGFLAWLRANKHPKAMSEVLASIWRRFPYRPVFREENIEIEVPNEFHSEGLDLDTSEEKVAPLFEENLSSDQEQSEHLVKPTEFLRTHKHDGEGEQWQGRSAWGRQHQKEMAEAQMNPELLGGSRLPHFVQTSKLEKNVPRAKALPRTERRRQEICDVFSLPLISGGTRQLENGQVVNLEGFAFTDKAAIDQARNSKTVKKNPVAPPPINSRNCAIYISSFVSELLAPLGHHLCLMPKSGRVLEEGKIYLRKVQIFSASGEQKPALAYKILEKNNQLKEGAISTDDIPSLERTINDPLDLDELKLFLPEILRITGCHGHGASLHQRKDHSHTNFGLEKWARQKLYTSPRLELLQVILEKNPFRKGITEELLSHDDLGPSDVVQAPGGIKAATLEVREFLEKVAEQHHNEVFPDPAGSYQSVKMANASIQEERGANASVSTVGMEPVYPTREEAGSRDAVELQPSQIKSFPQHFPSQQQARELQSLGRQLFCLACPGAINNENVEYASMEFCSYDDPELVKDFKGLSSEKQARFICALFFAGDAGKLRALSLVHSSFLSQDDYFEFIENYLACCKRDDVPASIIANHLCFLVERPPAYEEASSDRIHKTKTLFEKRQKIACEVLVALTHKDVESPIPVIHAQRLFYENPLSSRVRRALVVHLTENGHDFCMSRLLLVSFDEISEAKISINPSGDRFFDLRYLFNAKNPKHIEQVFALVVKMLVGDLGHHQAQGIAYYFTKDNRMEEFLNRSEKSSSNADILVKKLGELKDNCPQATARLAFAMMRAVIFRKKRLFKERNGAGAKPLLVRKLCDLFYPESESIVDVFLKIGLQVHQDAWRSNEKFFREIFKYALHKGKKKPTTTKPLDTPILLKKFIAQFAAMPETQKEREKRRAVLFTLAQVFLEHRLNTPFERGAFLLALDVYENRPLKAVLFGDFFRAACTLNVNAENKFAVLGKLMDAYYQDYQNGPVPKRMKDSAKLLKHEKSALFWALWCNLARNYAEHQAGEMASEIVREMLKNHCDQLPANPVPDLMSIFCLAPENFHQEDLKKLLLWLFLPRVKTDYRKFTRSFMNVLNSYMAAEVSYPEIIMGYDTTAEGRLAACRCTAMIIYSLYDSLFWQGGQRKLRMVKTKNKEANSKILGCASGMYKALSHLHKKAAIGVSLEVFVEKFSKSTIFSDMGFSGLVVWNIFVFIRRYQSKLDPNSYQFIGEYLETEDLQIDEEAFDLLIDGIDLDESSSIATDKGKQEAAPASPVDINNSNLEPTKSATRAPLQSELDEEEESTVSEEEIKGPTVQGLGKDSDDDEVEGSTVSGEVNSDVHLPAVIIAEAQENGGGLEVGESSEDSVEDENSGEEGESLLRNSR